jgi:rhodanese-related sulfurtransferase
MSIRLKKRAKEKPMATATQTLTKEMQMKDILSAFPSAQRALFQRYHVGGCSSCGFQETETLEEVCKSHNLADVNEVIQHILVSHEVDSKMQISVKDAAALLKSDKSAKLIDVRTEEEFQIASIKGALLINTDEAVATVMGWPKETPVVVHCHSGHRSMDAAAYLIGHGFTNVKSMTGGIDAWSAEIDPSVPRY